MYHNRPSDFYSWDTERQEAWNKNQSALEDAEYESRKAQQDAKDEVNRINRKHRADLQEQRDNANSEYQELNDIYEETVVYLNTAIRALHKIYSACGTMVISQGVNVGEVAQKALIDIMEIK
jgi:septum formation inhibitor MinC